MIIQGFSSGWTVASEHRFVYIGGTALQLPLSSEKHQHGGSAALGEDGTPQLGHC